MTKIKLYVVEPILFGYMFCSFLSVPVEQQLVYRKVCLQEFQNKTICDLIINSKNKSDIEGQNIIQKHAAHWGIYLDIGRSAPAVILTLLYGALSDRFGRKIIMIFPIIGDLSNIIFQTINSYFMDLHVGYLLFGVTFSSFFGGLACFLASVFSYVSDITDKTARTKRVIILESMIYLGGIISNLSGGLLLDKYGFMAVYILLICGYACQVIYWFFLSESYQPIVDDNSRNVKGFVTSFFDLKRAKECWNVIKNSRSRLKMYLYFSCFSCSVTSTNLAISWAWKVAVRLSKPDHYVFNCGDAVVFVAINSVSVLYLLRSPLEFTSAEIGYFFAEFNALKFIGALVLNFILIHTLKWQDHSMIFLSAIFYAAYALSISSAETHAAVYLAVLCTLGVGISTPGSRSGLSKLVLPSEQGRMFSMIAIIEVLVILSASPLAKYIYEQSVDISPALVYYVMAACAFFLFLFTSLLKIISRRENYNELQENDAIVN